MKLLALDFDGVISNSALESFIVALRTFRILEPESAVARVADSLIEADTEIIRQHTLFQGFLELMPLGNRAEDMGVALRRLSNGDRVPDQKAWDLLRGKESPEFLSDFHYRFYRERDILRDRDPEAWLRLLAPYSEFLDVLRRHRHECILALATAKDRKSVNVLLAAYSITDLFAPEWIVDKEAGVSKRSHISILQDRSGVAFSEITFVDDKLNHLEDVSALGVEGVLAAWGYNGERERRTAAQKGFLVCRLGEAETELF